MLNGGISWDNKYIEIFRAPQKPKEVDNLLIKEYLTQYIYHQLQPSKNSLFPPGLYCFLRACILMTLYVSVEYIYLYIYNIYTSMSSSPTILKLATLGVKYNLTELVGICDFYNHSRLHVINNTNI